MTSNKQRKGQMPEKTTKKTTVKKATVKKTTAKPAVKKTVTKKVATAPVAEKHPCGCDKGCACGGKCMENGCCAKKKCTFGRFLKKLILFVIIFALGFAAAKVCPCGGRGKMGPRPEFENGCLVIKCQKMAEMAPMMDADKDGCISKQEFKAARKHMREHNRPDVPAEPEMAAPAPQVAE